MSSRKVLLSAVAVLAPLGLIAVAAGPASAGVKPLRHQRLPLRATGAVQCSLSGDLSFSPPLTSVGTRPNTLDHKEKISINLTPSNCVTSDPTQAGTVPAVTIKPIPQKDETVPIGTSGKSIKVIGDCSMGFNPTMKNTELWTWGTFNAGGDQVPWDGSRVRFKSLAPIAAEGPSGDQGVGGAGHSSGSYKGTSGIALYFDPSSLAALQAVCQPGGSGSVSELALDPTQSVIGVGKQPVAQP